MGNTREWTREFIARKNELSAFVRSKAGRSEKARKNAVAAAASGRPATLSDEAREAVANRRAIAMVERLGAGE